MKIKMFRKKILLALAITAVISLPVLPSVFAQDYTDIYVNLTVDEGQRAEIALDGCWHLGGDEYAHWYEGSVSLIQPSNRNDWGDGPGDPADGEAHNWGSVTGTPVYDTLGEGQDLHPTDNNAFGYGDCKFTLTIDGYEEYNVQLYKNDEGFNDGDGHLIPDMRGSDTAGFDYVLDSEDPPYDYVENQGEHGFYIVAENIGDVLNDTGAAGEVSGGYTAQRPYNAIDCPSGTGSRPCYHLIPTESGTPQVLYDETSDHPFTDKTLIIREGVSADYSYPAGDYTMTLTVNVYTNP